MWSLTIHGKSIYGEYFTDVYRAAPQCFKSMQQLPNVHRWAQLCRMSLQHLSLQSQDDDVMCNITSNTPSRRLMLSMSLSGQGPAPTATLYACYPDYFYGELIGWESMRSVPCLGSSFSLKSIAETSVQDSDLSVSVKKALNLLVFN